MAKNKENEQKFGGGVKPSKKIWKKWWFWLIVVIAIGLVLPDSSDDSQELEKQTEIADIKEPETEEVDRKVETVDIQEAEPEISGDMNDSETNLSDPDASTTSSSQTVDNNDNIPSEYKSALSKAKLYSDTMHMSKVAIHAQLTSEYGEQFTEEAAQYAMDNLQADWNANALSKAENYSDTMYMSKAAIYDQLISEYGEQFTEEEAQYAVDNLQADYNTNALKKAESYQDTMAMSPSAIYDQLISEYGEQFTEEEAQYAIDNLK